MNKLANNNHKSYSGLPFDNRHSRADAVDLDKFEQKDQYLVIFPPEAYALSHVFYQFFIITNFNQLGIKSKIAEKDKSSFSSNGQEMIYLEDDFLKSIRF
jgi:hypothetical protein